MFEFFIALFGGAFWGTKLHSEKRQLKEFDEKQAAIKNAYDSGVQSWEALVVNRRLEHELMERLCNDKEFKQSAVRRMREELGDDTPEVLRDTGTHSTVIRYLLVKKGKLLAEDASRFGIQIVAPQPYNSYDKRRWEQEVRFIQWMGSQIKDFVPEATLMFKHPRTYADEARPAVEVSDYDGGAFFWDISSYAFYDRKFAQVQEQEWRENTEWSLDQICMPWFVILCLTLAVAVFIFAIRSA